MTDPALVGRKLASLIDHVQRIRDRRPADLAGFRSNPLVQDAIALSVLVIVQDAVEIATHICSDEAWGLPASYAEAFAVIARHGVIDVELAAALGGATRLRNRIAHGYGTLDTERLWNELPPGLRAFESFAASVAAYLQKPRT